MSDDEPVFFHGTRKGFTQGGYLFPKRFHQDEAQTSAPLNPGKERAKDSDEWVYITTNRLLAWAYAWAAPGRGKPKVLTVVPFGVVERDPEHGPDMEAYRAEGARVTYVDREPLMTEEEAREGWVTA